MNVKYLQSSPSQNPQRCRLREPELIYKTKSNYNYYRSAWTWEGWSGWNCGQRKGEGKMVGGRGAVCQLKLTNSSQFLAISLPTFPRPSISPFTRRTFSFSFSNRFRVLRHDLTPGLSMSRYSSLTLIAPCLRSAVAYSRMSLRMYTSAVLEQRERFTGNNGAG